MVKYSKKYNKKYKKISKKFGGSTGANRATVNGTLLLVSDLEGCATSSMDGVPQSTVLCSPEFFSAANRFLSVNPNNKIAFLGDYFDQGPDVLTSISGIANLHREYGNRVHIILGNRDINKLRLIYEMKPDIPIPQIRTVEEINGWNTWAKFFQSLIDEKKSNSNLVERFKNILIHSMGAGNMVKGNDWKSSDSRVNYNTEEKMYILLRCFSEKNATNLLKQITASNQIATDNKIMNDHINDVRYLFMQGRIVTHDKDFNVLLTHAGGINSNILHNANYYTNIYTLIKKPNRQLVDNLHYQYIESVRNLLEQEPSGNQKLGTNPIDFDVYNKPYITFIKKLFGIDLPRFNMFPRSKTAPKMDPKIIINRNFDDKIDFNFILLQGLGLSPSAPTTNFASFVGSCNNESCTGISTREISNEMLDKLRDKNIQIIAHGHKPHCAPIPLIYKKVNGLGKSIIFIDNDTSNGYKYGTNTLDQMPLSYIRKEGQNISVGVKSINTDGELIDTIYSLDAEPIQGKQPIRHYAEMIDEWNIDHIPTISEPSDNTCDSYIQYKTKKLTFPGGCQGVSKFSASLMTELGLNEPNKGKPNNGRLVEQLAESANVAANDPGIKPAIKPATGPANGPPLGTSFGGCKNCKHKTRKHLKHKP